MHAITSLRGRRADSERTEALAARREAAFEDLYRAQRARVFGYLRYRLGDDALAEDLTAETFARAWSRAERLGSEAEAVPWLFAVARNLAVDAGRRRRRTVPLAGFQSLPCPKTASPEEGAVAGERLALLARCLADLGERERDALALRFVAELPHRQIARVLGTSEGNAAKIVHRALLALRKRLAQEEVHDV